MLTMLPTGVVARLHGEAHELFDSIGDIGGVGNTLSRLRMSAFCLGELAS